MSPVLPNISETGPYFHDGSVKKLERAVEVVAEVQRGVSRAADERGAIVEFPRSLRGAVLEKNRCFVTDTWTVLTCPLCSPRFHSTAST